MSQRGGGAGPSAPDRQPRSLPSTVVLGLIAGLIIGAVVIGGILGFVLVAHQGPVAETPLPSAPASTPDGSGAPGSPAAAVSSARPSSATANPSGPRATIDRSLLAVLPATVAGLAVTEFPEAETQAIMDPDLGRSVSRVATAFVGDASGANWAYTSVVDVRVEAQSDAFYRDWQESFDASACERAGGVTGHTTLTIAGREVERTACGAGVRTYHVRVSGTRLLVSISDLGPAKFGEQELAELRP